MPPVLITIYRKLRNLLLGAKIGLCLTLLYASGALAETPMNNMVSVNVYADKVSLLDGPVAATVEVSNVSADTIEISLPYPNPNNLTFSCLTEGFATQKQVKLQEIERTIPIRIMPGANYSSVYYLNRYFAFHKSGDVRISYQLRALVSSKIGTAQAIHEQASFTGQFQIKLIEGSQHDLQTQMASFSGRLKSTDRQEKMEAAEALAFLDTPLSVEYIVPMPSIDNLEIIGIEALSRHPSEKSYDLIIGMLSHRDSAVVAAALNSLDRLRVPIARNDIYKLLGSENANNRWLALDWLSKRPAKQDLPLMVPLVKDQNDAVRDMAKRYVEVIRGR
jgi:hypothetical protein